jgi:hypothetical protein
MSSIGYVLLIVASLVHVALMRGPRNAADAIEIVLGYAFLFIVALSGFIAFLGHTLRADEIARQIGWQAGNPFQSEVAAANLAFGVLGLLAFRFRGDFWLATAIGYAVFLIGAGVVHIYQIIAAGNRAPLNAGAAILAADLLVPVVLLILVVIHRRLAGRKSSPL